MFGSFFLPQFRVKQDTIPGMRIPIHFTPSKTTDQIRNEMTLTEHLPTTRNLDRYVAMKDYKDASGNVILAKGDYPNDESISKLLASGIHDLPASSAGKKARDRRHRGWDRRAGARRGHSLRSPPSS